MRGKILLVVPICLAVLAGAVAQAEEKAAPPQRVQPEDTAIEKYGDIVRNRERPGQPVISVKFGCHSDVPDAVLAQLKTCPELATLHIISDNITDAGLKHLQGLPKLKTLNLNSATITDQGLEHLKSFPALEELGLMRMPLLTSEGFVHLKALPNLKKLILSRIPASAAALPHLKEMRHLEYLSLGQYQSYLSKDTIMKEWTKALPGVKVVAWQ